MSDRVTVNIDGGVADVRLNRPDKLNALDPPMFEALVETGEALAADPSVRAVVLSGEGRSFCAGLDFSSFQAMAGGGRAGGDGGSRQAPEATPRVAPAAEGERLGNRAQRAAYVWAEMPVPTIAAVRGHALGGGFQIALACDLRIVHPEARLSILEIRWGLVPDMTGTQLIVRLMPIDKAKELTWTGRQIDGREAAELGLATRLSEDPLADALALAHEIAAKSPHAIRGAKRLLDMAGRVPLAEGFAEEARIQASLIGSPNNIEAVTAFFEKRDPVFSDVDA